MRDKFDRVRAFVDHHRQPLIYTTSGVCIGVAATMLAVSKRTPALNDINVFLDETPEQLMAVMKSSGGLKITNAITDQKLYIFSNPALEVI